MRSVGWLSPGCSVSDAWLRCSQAAADTLAMGSLEVDLSGIEEGNTVTVKWRGKPVFIKHRTDEEIAAASVPVNGLVDPETDAARTVDPKVCVHGGMGWACMRGWCLSMA